jgi:hypothetical protein
MTDQHDTILSHLIAILRASVAWRHRPSVSFFFRRNVGVILGEVIDAREMNTRGLTSRSTNISAQSRAPPPPMAPPRAKSARTSTSPTSQLRDFRSPTGRPWYPQPADPRIRTKSLDLGFIRRERVSGFAWHTTIFFTCQMLYLRHHGLA